MSLNNEIKKYTYKIIPMMIDHVKLALHVWLPLKPQAIVFYVHGVQSHAGWLFETGPLLASHSIAVFVLDRRGVGMSEGLRGDISTASQVLNDYYTALQYVRKKFPALSLTLLGQSMGGSILAALVSMPEFSIQYDKILFCAAALGKHHAQYSDAQRQLMASRTSTDLMSIDIHDQDYTDDLKYLTFMQQDKLGGKKITERSHASLLEIEKIYLQNPGVISQKESAYIYPEVDPVINLPKAIEIFQLLSGKNGLLKSFPVKKHYLWFTEAKNALTAWLISFVLNQEECV